MSHGVSLDEVTSIGPGERQVAKLVFRLFTPGVAADREHHVRISGPSSIWHLARPPTPLTLVSALLLSIV